ncbi:MAG: hypothetical protein KME15_23515 [Drouetiella hepatica Uher 2000/2452]|uniref:Uncharacterized protein n=1 Tax=Drouetiella hepatica Uher 2000/2452 TaxID=904376 RepID=A0A951QFJ6_9CYAN|nr:hypothetical protein [Drouetiella hepatica Uher 2000/2452]
MDAVRMEDNRRSLLTYSLSIAESDTNLRPKQGEWFSRAALRAALENHSPPHQ